MTIETYEPFATPDTFCEGLVRIDRVGGCRRLIFYATDTGCSGGPARAIVAKLIIQSQDMAAIAQMIGADRADFPRLAFDSTAH